MLIEQYIKHVERYFWIVSKYKKLLMKKKSNVLQGKGILAWEACFYQ